MKPRCLGTDSGGLFCLLLYVVWVCLSKVPVEQLHYRGRQDQDPLRMGHSIESTALLLVLATLPSRSKLASTAKTTCLRLLVHLVRTAAESRGACSVPQGASFSFGIQPDGMPHQVDLSFNDAGATENLQILEELRPPAASTWKQLTKKAWNGVVVGSSLALASAWDILLWCAWAKIHPAVKKAWTDVAPWNHRVRVSVVGNTIHLIIFMEFVNDWLEPRHNIFGRRSCISVDRCWMCLYDSSVAMIHNPCLC